MDGSMGVRIGIVAAAIGIAACGVWGCGRAPRSGPREETDATASPSAPAETEASVAAEDEDGVPPAAEAPVETASAHCDRGKALYDQGDLQGAVAACSKAISLDPGLAEAYYARGLARQDAGETDLAIADFTKAIEEQPDFTDAFNARGLAYLLKCDYARTRSDLREVIELDPHGETGASAKENLELLGPQ